MIRTGLVIESPEGITFSYELASLTDRGKAFLLDLLIRVGVMVVIAIIFLISLGPAIFAGIGLWLILFFAVEWCYYTLFDLLWSGQSPGKRIFHLRVVKAAGHPIGFLDSVLRNLLRAADGLPVLGMVGSYAAGALAMLATDRFQRLGDLVAGTVVIHERRAWYVGARARDPEAGDLDAVASGASLRGLALSNRERQLLNEFVQRKDRLHPDRREQLAEILAKPYAERFGIEWEEGATELLLRIHGTQQQRDSR